MRPTKLTPETVTVLCDALEKGMYLETASRMAGVAPSTLHGWLRRGKIAEQSENPEADELPFLELLDAVKKAQATAEMRAVEVISAAANAGTWQAAAWFLERSNPGAWSRTGRTANASHHDPDRIETHTSAMDSLMQKLGLSFDDGNHAA